MTARVAIECRRHSISADVDDRFPGYVRQHLDQIEGGGLLPKDYRLIEREDWSDHPVFRSAAPAVAGN